MKHRVTAQDITIRTHLRSGDIGCITYLHGILYEQEYHYDIRFESYVAAGLYEFVQHYQPGTSRVWICEHKDTIIGSLFLMNRGEAAQLRYFLLQPEYRGIGLGKILMDLYMDFLHECTYRSSYLWTTHEQDTAAVLYKKYGFKLTEEKHHTGWGKPLTEQRYDWQV